MIRHHARALIVPASDLTQSDRPAAWADQARGMGRRPYDSWAACLPSLLEGPVPGDRETCPTVGDAPPAGTRIPLDRFSATGRSGLPGYFSQ